MSKGGAGHKIRSPVTEKRFMCEFLKYGRLLGPDEVDVDEASPTLKEFKRELHSVQNLRSVLSGVDDVTVLQRCLNTPTTEGL